MCCCHICSHLQKIDNIYTSPCWFRLSSAVLSDLWQAYVCYISHGWSVIWGIPLLEQVKVCCYSQKHGSTPAADFWTSWGSQPFLVWVEPLTYSRQILSCLVAPRDFYSRPYLILLQFYKPVFGCLWPFVAPCKLCCSLRLRVLWGQNMVLRLWVQVIQVMAVTCTLQHKRFYLCTDSFH